MLFLNFMNLKHCKCGHSKSGCILFGPCRRRSLDIMQDGAVLAVHQEIFLPYCTRYGTVGDTEIDVSSDSEYLCFISYLI